MFEFARREQGFSDEAWRLFLLDWGGVERSEELYVDTPTTHRGANRVLDRLYVTGFRHVRLVTVGVDYLQAVLDLQRALGVSEAGLAAVVASAGHPIGWPLMSIGGATFQRLVVYFRALGSALPLGRSWISPDQIAFLDETRRSWSVKTAMMPAILRDFGGGVHRVEDLDAAGYERVLVYFEAKAGARAARALDRDEWVRDERDPVRRLWPEWHRPLA